MLPLWSAAVDPRVLTARAFPERGTAAGSLDLRGARVRTTRGRGCEHLVIDRGGQAIRLDLVEGSLVHGPVSLRIELDCDARLDAQLDAIGALRAVAGRRHERLTRGLRALVAVAARDAGASLREVAAIARGPGVWPGEGEQRKSHVRRLLLAGSRLIRAGPRPILALR